MNTRDDLLNLLIIADTTQWVLGEIAEQIRDAVSNDGFRVAITSSEYLRLNPSLARRLLNEADVIHALTEGMLDAEFMSALSAKVLTSIHHATEWTRAHALATSGAGVVLVPTEHWKRVVLRNSSLSEQRVIVVPYGVDPTDFQICNIRRWSEEASAPVVGYVGSAGSDRDRGRKGLDLLFDAVRRLSQIKGREIGIAFAGIGWSDLALTLSQSNVKARSVGYLDKRELRRFYNQIDVLLVTSRVEGGPCTVLEAMACGCPVVSTDVGMVSDVVVPNVNGLMCQANSEAIENAVREVLSCHWRRDKSTIRATVIPSYSWSRSLCRLAGIYRGIATKVGVSAWPTAFVADIERRTRALDVVRCARAEARASIGNALKISRVAWTRGDLRIWPAIHAASQAASDKLFAARRLRQD